MFERQGDLFAEKRAEKAAEPSEEPKIYTVTELTREIKVLLEKSFPIQGRTDGLVLVCRFLVTTEGVGLSERWLAKPEDTNNKASANYITYPPVQITEFD